MSDELEQGMEPTEGADDSQLTVGQEPEPQAPTFEQLYEKHGLKDRWKAENEVDLIEKTLTSYSQLEQHKRTIESENAQLRQALIAAAQQGNFQRQQQQFQQQPPVQRQPKNPEEEAADKFVQERFDHYYQEKVLPELRKRDEAFEQLEFNNYMSLQMANPVFKELYDSQELGQRVQWMANQGIRINAQVVDKVFKDIIAEKYPGQMAQVQQKAFTQGQDFNKQKEQAFVQGGGKSQRTLPSDFTTALKQLESDDVSYEQALALAQKKGWLHS